MSNFKAKIDAQQNACACGAQVMPTASGYFCPACVEFFPGEVEKIRLALENCLMLAMRMQRKAHKQHVTCEEWDHIRRFCEEAGVKPSILREEQGNG